MQETGTYIDIKTAAEKLTEIGVPVSKKSLHNKAEPDARGKRRLPFFKCPITGKLLIDEGILFGMYKTGQQSALNNCARKI